MNLNLACACGTAESFETNEAAYRAGWRLAHGIDQLCPACAGRREKRKRADLVKRCGEAAVAAAERSLALYGE